ILAADGGVGALGLDPERSDQRVLRVDGDAVGLALGHEAYGVMTRHVLNLSPRSIVPQTKMSMRRGPCAVALPLYAHQAWMERCPTLSYSQASLPHWSSCCSRSSGRCWCSFSSERLRTRKRPAGASRSSSAIRLTSRCLSSTIRA